MEHANSSRVIRSRDAAAFLTDPARVRFLLPFLGRERTLSAVAGELGVAINVVLYRAQQLLTLELLRVSREEMRAGRAIKHYQSSAEAYFVPFELMPFESVEAQIQGLEERSQQHFTRALARVLQRRRAGRAWGTRIYLDAHGHPTIDSAPAPDVTDPELVPEWGAFSTWSTITLTPEVARTFSQRLQALRDDLITQATGDGDQYIVHLGVVGPTGGEEG